MITKNFKIYQQLSMIVNASPSLTKYGFAPTMTDVLNVKFYWNGNRGNGSGPIFLTSSVIYTSTNDSGISGIIIGSGTTPPTEDDYLLENRIKVNFTNSIVYTYGADNDSMNPYILALISMNNNTANPITISELGWCNGSGSSNALTGFATSGPNTGNTTNHVVLLDRTLLSTPLTLQPGDSGTISYKVQTITNYS